MKESLKDGIRFLAGLSILGWETLAEDVDRPWIIVAALGLLGYGGVARLAERLK